MKNAQLAALATVGQSVWYDNLSRAVLESGELKNLIDQGVLGLTSNPTIFKKAIADSADYDEDLKALIEKGLDSEGIAEDLMIGDVAAAADLLLPLYEKSNKVDGYASIEVSPRLANDTEGTVEAGKRIWEKLQRPNIMIKVPATEAGIPAITSLLEAGINVNVTLIFSVPVYKQVIDAYITALEKRKEQGLALEGIASVASFFISRVDAITEKTCDALIADGKLEASLKDSVLGKVGIANSKAAYKLFEDEFGGSRFQPLAAAGAVVQRPLWASTGTKNPDFSKVLYVEELAGKDTVNTVPPATLEAVMEDATIEPRLHENIEASMEVLSSLEVMGVNLSELLYKLQVDGVAAFAKDYESLLSALEEKCANV